MPFFDGTNARIYYRIWEVDEPVAGFVFLHGGGEHSGQYSRLASILNAADINVFAIDHQGHGISGGPRHDFGSVPTLVSDVNTLVDIVRAAHPGLPLVIGGHSLGSITTSARLVDAVEPFVGAVLVGWPGSSLAENLEGDEAVLIVQPDGTRRFNTARLAEDPSYLEELEKDPLVQLELPAAPPNFGSSLVESAQRTDQGIGDVTIPLLVINGTRESKGTVAHGRRLAEELANVVLLEIPNGLHNVINDVDYRQVSKAIRDFVLDVTAPAVAAVA